MAKKVFTDESLGTLVSEIKAYTDNVENKLDDYLPKSGGTMTGDITFGNSSAGVYIHDDKYDCDVNAIRFYSDALQIGDNGYDMTLNSYQDLIHYREDDENEVFEYKIVDEYNAASLIPAVLNDAGAYVPYAFEAERALNADCDYDGNEIRATYLKKSDASNTYLPKSTNYAASSSVAGAAMNSDKTLITRITTSTIADIVAALSDGTDITYFVGSDGEARGCPEANCIIDVKRAGSGRSFMHCYGINTGNHYINTNADASNTSSWTGWKLQPNENTINTLTSSINQKAQVQIITWGADD